MMYRDTNIPRHQRPRFCLGLDLGKQTDFSALAALRAPWPSVDPPVYQVPTLQRWPLGTAYLDIVADVAAFLKAPPLSGGGEVLLAVDATGVGDAVYEMVREQMARAGLTVNYCGVTITAGSAVTQTGEDRWRVAKKQLVSVLQVLLGHRRLQIAESLPEARTLAHELGTFSVKITESANETFESWRERDHDDLVLAVALAAWASEYGWFAPPNSEEQATLLRA
jgi:hypothetical protein